MADNGFATFARAKLQSMPDLSSQPCIYKAPNHIREVNEECYRPYVISIGPLYYGLSSLEAMQDCKWSCLKLFLEHDSNSYRLDLEHYLRIIGEMEGRVRNSYTEGITLPSDVFNGMILLDSAFIICLFMNNHPKLSSSMVILLHMYKRNLLMWGPKLTRDLFLLENQVPFFVLEHLFQEAFGASDPNTSLLGLALGYIVNSGIPVIKRHHLSATTAERIKNAPNIEHLVDLLRIFCFPSILRDQAVEPTSCINVVFPFDVSHLRAVGVKFVASKSSNLLDITFCKGVLEIPPIQIRDSSESFYRSMILFEQSHAPISWSSYIVDYMAVLEKLIRTPEDVQILVECGIIDNRIGREDAVVRLFNDITKHLVFPSQFYFFDVCQDLNIYANTRWNQWKAILKRDYIGHPWATISVIYALILLILALLQTVGFGWHSNFSAAGARIEILKPGKMSMSATSLIVWFLVNGTLLVCPAHTDLSPQPCIYKAPIHVREVNEECYLPYVISIGPLFYGLPSLEAMQDCKLRYLKFFLEHDSNSHRSDLEHYLRFISEMEGRVRHCYTERFTLPSDEFNGMILLDSAFIICHFYMSVGVPSLGMIDIYKRNLLIWGAKLTRDLFLLENQVPFFVLERLFEDAFGAAHPDTSFRDLAYGYIVNVGVPVFPRHHVSAATTERIKSAPEIAHLVDLLRIFCLPSTLRLQAVEATGWSNVQCPSVSNLRAAGVKFVASKSTNLLDITFYKGVLEIPQIQLYDASESYYRSMVLFEQSHLPIKRTSYIVDYLALLEKLIKVPEDVRILVQCGILDNWIGSEDAVARHFNGITKHLLLPNKFYYFNVCRDLNAYANTRWNQWKAILKKDYFSHPWATISVIYAIMLFILTLLQTIGTFTNN